MDALYVGLILLFAIVSMIGLTVCVRRLGHKCWPILRNCKAIIISQRQQQQAHADTKQDKLNGSASKNPFSSMLHRSSITPTRQNVTKVDIHVESASDKANLSELLKPVSASFDSSERRASREDKICLLIKRASELQLQATSADSTSPKKASSVSLSEAASMGKGAKKQQITVGSPVGGECSIALATAETSCDETDDEQTDALVRMRPHGDVLLQMEASTGVELQKEAAVLSDSEKDNAGAHKQRLPALFASPFTRRRNRPSFTFAYSQDFADNGGVDEDRLMLQICPASVPDAPGNSKAVENVRVGDTCGSPGLRQQQQSNSLEEKSDRLMPLHPFHRQKQLELDESSRENNHKPPDSRRELRERKLQRFIKSMDIDSDSDSACSSKVSNASSRPRLQHELSIPTDSGVSCTMSSNVPHPHASLGSTLSVQRPPNGNSNGNGNGNGNSNDARPAERRQKRLTFAYNRSQSNYESGEVDATAKNQSNVVIQIRQLTEEDDAEKTAASRPRQTMPKVALSKQRSVDNGHLPPDSVPKTRRAPNEMASAADPPSPARSSSSFFTPDHSDDQSDADDCADAHARAIQSRADELLRALTQTVLLGGISRSQQGLNAQPDRDRGVLLDPASLLHHASTLGSLSNSTRCCACQCHHHAPPGSIDPHSLLLVQTVLPLVLRNSLGSLRKKKRRRSRTRQHSRSSNALHADSHAERSSLRTFDDESAPPVPARSSDCAERHDTSKDDSSNTSGCHAPAHSHAHAHHTRPSRNTPRSSCPPTDLRKTHRHRTGTADGAKPRSSVSSATDDSSLHGRVGALIGHKIWHHDDDQDAFDPCV